MADEIKVTTSLSYSNGTSGALGSLTVSARSQSITQNTAAPTRAGGTQTIGFAAHEALVVTDITTLGWARFRTRDAANFVQIGLDVAAAFVPLVRLNAGEECVFRLSQGITVYAQADTGAVIMDRDILDD